MKRSDIKIGSDYAVTRRSTQNTSPVRATIVQTDAPREVSVGTWSRQTTTKTDGILVRFSEPVVPAYDSFEPLSRWLERADNYQPYVLEEKRKLAVSEAVLSAREILETWESYAAKQEAIQARHTQQAERLKATHDAIHARMTAVGESLADDGLAYSWSKKTTSLNGVVYIHEATLVLTLDEAEALVAS